MAGTHQKILAGLGKCGGLYKCAGLGKYPRIVHHKPLNDIYTLVGKCYVYKSSVDCGGTVGEGEGNRPPKILIEA